MTKLKHKKVSTKIKQLAEKRARVWGRLLPLDGIETELSKKVEQLSLDLKVALHGLESCRAQKQSLTVELQQCDEALASLDPKIDPSKIEPIQGSKGRYGSHGSLKNAVFNLLEEASPQYLTSTQIADAIIWNLNLVFESDESQYLWKRRSIKNALCSIVNDGNGERGTLVKGGKGALNTTWRLKSEGPTLLSEL